MSTVIRHQVHLRGHERDITPLIKGRGKRIMGGIVGAGWDVSIKGEHCDYKVIEFFSKLSPLKDDVVRVSKRHPKVLIQWSYFYAEGPSEGIVVASGGKVYAAGWWPEPHADNGICDCEGSDGGE